MKKVLQIANYMYPAVGGIGQTTLNIADALSKDGIEQKILCFNCNAKMDHWETHQRETVTELIDGVEIIRCGVFANVFSQSLSFNFGKVLKRVLNEFDPDVVIFQYPNPLMSFHLLQNKGKRFKLIVFWNSDIVKQKGIRLLFRKQNFDLLKRSWKVIATSPDYIKGSVYLRKAGDKCVIIPCCIREDHLALTKEIKTKADRLRKSGKIICFALGRHVTYKGFRYLIEASRYLDDRFLIIIGGEGPLTGKLKSMARGDRKVRFTGRLSEEALKMYYHACDIFCFPSITKNEAFGMALADALYFGKPAVTFKIEGSGVGYVNLNGITGIECENRNAKQYAGALLKLADDRELRRRLGENARKRAETKFLYQQFKEAMSELIDQCEADQI